MATFLNNVSGTGVRAELVDQEDLFVAKGVTVVSTDDSAITSAGGASSGHTMAIAGHLEGQMAGVVIGNGPSDHDQALYVWQGGELKGDDFFGAQLFGSHVTVNNAGSIIGGTAGLELIASSGQASSITNSGLIQGGAIGIESVNASDQTLTIRNSGVITGSQSSFNETGKHGADNLLNTGIMDGEVSLSLGDDTYDGRKGHVQGTVYGHDGNDTMLGGTEANTFVGGDGNDTLFGGKGNDTFIFDAQLGANNIDTVNDFANNSGDNDTIGLSNFIFTGLADGMLSAKAFHVGAKAGDALDRVIYDQKHGDLYYDHDGTGSAAAVKFAHLDNHAHLTAADFIVM